MKTTYEQLQSSYALAFLAFVSPEIAKSIKAKHLQALPVNRTTPWEDWNDKTGFKPELYLRADSWQPMPKEVFDHLTPGKPVRFGGWTLVRQVWPQTQKMRLYQKSGDRPKLGWAQFDKPICNVVLIRDGDHYPVMSLTPNEMISVRTGARKAKGDVVITGLGLGYLLWLVANRPQVRSVTLIEIDPYVIAYMMPRLKKHLKIQPKVILGNAYEIVPKLKGDVALFDHFDSYGWNKDYIKPELLKGFGSHWVWG